MSDAAPYVPRRALPEPDPFDDLGQLAIALDELASQWEVSAARRGDTLLAEVELEHARETRYLIRRLP